MRWLSFHGRQWANHLHTCKVCITVARALAVLASSYVSLFVLVHEHEGHGGLRCYCPKVWKDGFSYVDTLSFCYAPFGCEVWAACRHPGSVDCRSFSGTLHVRVSRWHSLWVNHLIKGKSLYSLAVRLKFIDIPWQEVGVRYICMCASQLHEVFSRNGLADHTLKVTKVAKSWRKYGGGHVEKNKLLFMQVNGHSSWTW